MALLCLCHVPLRVIQHTLSMIPSSLETLTKSSMFSVAFSHDSKWIGVITSALTSRTNKLRCLFTIHCNLDVINRVVKRRIFQIRNSGHDMPLVAVGIREVRATSGRGFLLGMIETECFDSFCLFPTSAGAFHDSSLSGIPKDKPVRGRSWLLHPTEPGQAHKRHIL